MKGSCTVEEKEKEKETQSAETSEEIVSEDNVGQEVEHEAEVEAAVEETEIDLLKKKVSELEDQNLRLQAEMINVRNRNQKDREAAAKYRSQDLAKELLPAIDNLERALESDVDGEHHDALKKGVQMVLDNLKQALKNQGVEEIPALGETFNPNFHQAVQTTSAADEGVEPETIVKEFQKGYTLYDRVLRPAMVVVAQ